MNYYNDNDRHAAQWLRQLIKGGLIPPGDVDERSIEDVHGSELRKYTQCHFFAGIGGWSEALRLAGWPVDRPVWTGSCPCQPFANPGRKSGVEDKRHLWPAFRNLIKECRPAIIFGEQVESPLGRSWLAAVLADLEASQYRVACAGLPAACVGSPQARARLWWLADADDSRREGSIWQGESNQARKEWSPSRRESMRSIGRSWPPGPGSIDKIPLLANGLPGAMGGCRGYGNAIVPPLAAEFIGAYLDGEG